LAGSGGDGGVWVDFGIWAEATIFHTRQSQTNLCLRVARLIVMAEALDQFVEEGLAFVERLQTEAFVAPVEAEKRTSSRSMKKP
jgi:hypothetical protein